MLISEVISELESLLEEHGDLPVFVYDDTYADVPASRAVYREFLSERFPERITVG